MQRTTTIFLAMLYRHLLEMFRYPITMVSHIVSLIIMAFVFHLAIQTFMIQPGTRIGPDNLGTLSGGIMLYGFILFLFVSDTLWSIGYHMRLEQIEGTLESCYLTPVNPLFYVISRAMYPLVWTSMNVSILLLSIWLLMGALPAENIGLAISVFILTLSGVLGLGLCFAALTLILKETAQVITNLTQFLLLTLCAIVVPFQSLPDQLRIISYCIPLSYGIDLFRSALLGFPPGFPELVPTHTAFVLIIIWAVGMPTVGYCSYRSAEYYVRIHGTLAEF